MNKGYAPNDAADVDGGMVDVYVITSGDEERVRRIKRILSDIDFEFVFSEDLSSLVAKESAYRKTSHQFRQKAIMAGEIGAFMTHSYAWERVSRSRKPAIIIEDNVDFIRDPISLLNQDILALIEGCGVVSFTDFAYKIHNENPFLISSVAQKKPFPIVCYGLMPERATTLLKSMKKNPYILPVDKWLSVPGVCGCSCFVSPKGFAKRAADLPSIANKRKGKKTFNPLNMVLWVFNKIKYKY